MKPCKKRLCIKQVNRSVRVHNRDWKRWYDRHTRWIEYALPELEFRESDIELMLQAVTEHDSKSQVAP